VSVRPTKDPAFDYSDGRRRRTARHEDTGSRDASPDIEFDDGPDSATDSVGESVVATDRVPATGTSPISSSSSSIDYSAESLAAQAAVDSTLARSLVRVDDTQVAARTVEVDDAEVESDSDESDESVVCPERPTTRRKARIISQLERRAPLAVKARVQSWDKEFLANEQEADPDIAEFLAVWKNDALINSWAHVKHLSATTRALWRQRDSLIIVDRVLYRKFYASSGLVKFYQLVLPTSLRMACLELIHADKAGHLKFDKCCVLLQEKAWWLTWKRDLKWFIACCKRCQAHHEGKPPHQVMLTPLLHGEPRQRWSIDLTGPFRSCRGYRYMFTAVDCFSRFAVVVPIRNKEAITVVHVVNKHIFLVHGYGDL
jgi:hypothetical protein